MFEDIQQVESAIKAGDTKTGFEILRTYLTKNPESERAWWIMSGMVDREQRRTCLEQVLRINPNNRLARETLDKLLYTPPEPESKPQREIPDPPAPDKGAGYPLQAFLYKRGSRIYLTILGGKRLVHGYTKQRHIPVVRDMIKAGNIPDQYLAGMKIIPLDFISNIQHKGAALEVDYQEGASDQSLIMPYEDKNKARGVLGVLTKELGPTYMIQTRPIKTGFNLVISTLLTGGSVVFTSIIIWTAQQINKGIAVAGWRDQMIANLLESRGASGLVLICAALVLASLGVSAWLLLKPPVSTELVRRD